MRAAVAVPRSCVPEPPSRREVRARRVGAQYGCFPHSSGQRFAAAPLPLHPNPSAYTQRFSRERSAKDSDANFGKCFLTCRGRVITEWRESAVVRCAELLDRNVLGSLQDSVTNFFRR